MILQFLANGFVSGALYAIVGLGFGLIYNTTRIFHLAHAAVYVVSAYLFYLCHRVLNLPLGLSISFGLSGAIIFGILTEILVYRPLYERKAAGSVALISSLGVYILTINFIALIFGSETKILSIGIQKTHQIGSIKLTNIQLVEISAFIILAMSYFLFLRRTKLGRFLRALADNAILLSVLGTEVSLIRVAVFGIGSLLAGVSACLLAIDVGIDPFVGMPAMLVSAVAVIIGGTGVFGSAALGGFIVGILQTLAIWKFSARWQDLVTFFLLIVFLLLKPQGILGRKKRVEEL